MIKIYKCVVTFSVLFMIRTASTENRISHISPNIVIRNAERSIDLSTQLTKITCKLTAENTGKGGVPSILFSVEEDNGKLSYLSAVLGDTGKSPLKTEPTSVAGKKFYLITLKDPLLAGKTVVLEIEYVLSEALTPYPTAITQKEKQLVKFNGNSYVFLPYKSLKQSTVFHLIDRNIEFYSKVNPVSQTDNTISYGPYQNVEAFSQEPIIIHYENNSPFLKVTRIERVIEVSHWGNIAIEETIDLLHVGATLKGPFSRYEFQREAHSGLSSVKSFKTILPASASDVYYRDDIGNISTSHMKLLSDSVEVDLRPRFPLFGGWKTHYTLGYNVPSYEYLYNSGDNYKLKMRLLDHIFDDMVVEELITRIILPEGSEEVTLTTPYQVNSLPHSRHSTYLDVKGRYVISVRASNLVEDHIQDFELDYIFPRILMLQEPLLVVVALYLMFLLVIIYVRLDFSISKDEIGESKMRVSGLLEKILIHQDARANAYKQQDEQLSKLKSHKEVSHYLGAMKSINQEYKNETTQITELLSKLKPDAPEVAEKVSELQKLDKHLKEIYTQKQSLYVDKLVPGKIGRGPFVEAETTLNKKKEDTIEKINSIMKSLH